MGKVIIGIIVIVVVALGSGVAGYWLHKPPPCNCPSPGQSTGATAPTLTFLEKVAGEYTLSSWQQANSPMILGVSVEQGSLRIDSSGNADWQLKIWDSLLHPIGPPSGNKSGIKCGGSVMSSSQTLRWVSGGQRNSAIDWVRGIESKRNKVWLAFCGGNVQESALFRLFYQKSSTGKATLAMNNSKGYFVWQKR